MDKLNINNLLNRNSKKQQLIDYLNYFEKNKHDILTKRGIYVYGSPGTGKTFFVKSILKELNYDIISFDAGDVRNKNIIENIAKHNMADKSIISLFKKEKKNIAIIMDEIDGMNSGDKGGINALIKLIRPKKTKKQKKEDITMNPIICIGNYHIDKKIKEMMKICDIIELETPKKKEIKNIVKLLMPNLDDTLNKNIVNLINGDLRKLVSTYNIYNSEQNILKDKLIKNLFYNNTYNEDTKILTKDLLNNYHKINEHHSLLNDTDRTSVALLFHENIIDVLSKFEINISLKYYIKILKNICFSDYIDRITFQKQIWIFNEMSSLIKTFYNNYIYHKQLKKNKKVLYNPVEVRFTKVLTKYSTEYNNSLFIQNLCQQLNMDKKDMLSYFIYLKNTEEYDNILELFQNNNYEINKLDIARIYRYINNHLV